MVEPPLPLAAFCALSEGNRTLISEMKHHLGAMPPSFALAHTIENVAIPLILKKRDWDESIAEAHKYLKIVGLENRADLPPVKLSGGEQQRVAIARAIVSQPDILILDEPTASLDGDTGKSIVSFVRNEVLNDKRCIVIVTHDARIYEFAHRVLRMEDGELKGIDDGASIVGD